MRTISGRLGHANAARTLGVYAHFLTESDRDAAATVEDLRTTPRQAACDYAIDCALYDCLMGPHPGGV